MATLGEQTIGSIVKLNVDGVATNFIVVHQGLPGTMYDSSCDGTWLLMEDIYESRVWDSYDNDYANSDIHSYLNNTFVNLFDSDIKSVIKQVKLPYTNGTSSGGSLATGSRGISAKVFLLSHAEVMDGTHSYANAEGAVLSHFDGAAASDRIAYLDGTAITWWLRSPHASNTVRAWGVYASGTAIGSAVDESRGVRPALVLPPEIAVSSDGMVGDSGAITGSVTIGGVQRELTGEGYVNINGVLRPLVKSQVNIGGVLRDLRPKEVYTWKKYNIIQVEGAPYTSTKLADYDFEDYTSLSKVTIGNGFTFSSATGKYTLTNSTYSTVSEIDTETYKYFWDGHKENENYVRECFMHLSNERVFFNIYESSGTIQDAMGTYIGDVTSENASAYPDNGGHIDGYWYVKQ